MSVRFGLNRTRKNQTEPNRPTPAGTGFPNPYSPWPDPNRSEATKWAQVGWLGSVFFNFDIAR